MSKFLNIFLVVAIIALILFNVRTCTSKNDITRKFTSELLKETFLRKNTEKELEIYRNDFGDLVTKNKELTFENEELLEEAFELNKKVKKLEGKVKSVTEVINRLELELKIPTEIVFMTDSTELTDSMIVTLDNVIYPTYKGTFTDDWVTVKTVADKDSIAHDITMTDSIGIIHTVKKRLFRPDEYFIYSMSYNPYVTDTQTRSYKIVQDKKLLDFGIYLGYGIDIQGNPNPQIGVGVFIKPQALLNRR